MKVRTNLDSDKLEKIGKGLIKLSKSQKADKFPSPDNPAEAEIIKDLNNMFELLTDSLQTAVVTHLLEENK